ncbi:MAG: aminotransferase class V-fold PLP-dependent enzyme, partial [Oscillospiraceae bacterium]|nr:aminotransferase class V-fold PLP-dependent enzyme [Oscillospiraceae bacterium]
GSDGALRAQAVLDACREDTFLVSVCAVCAETGAAQPLDALGRELKAKYPAALFHTDAVQAFLRMPLDPKTLRADLLSVSGHKIGAPKGIGALYVRRGLRLAPEIHGGGQEGGLRSGTSNAPLAAAFAAAVKNYVCVPDGLWLYAKESLQSVGARVLPLPDGARAPHILCFALESAALGRFLPGEVLVRMLSDKGVFISAGSACKRGKRGPALDGAALPPGMADGMVRASFSGETAKADIDALCEALRGL